MNTEIDIQLEKSLAEKEKDFKDTVVKKFEEAFAEFKRYNDEWGDWGYCDYEDEFKANILYRSLTDYSCKLNYFTYNDVYHGRCDYREGSCSGFLTPLSEHQLKEKMKEYAEKLNGEKYCHHAFLKSVSDFGIYTNSEYGFDYYGNMVSQEIDLEKIKESDILSSEKYSEIIAAREKVIRDKAEAEKAKQTALFEQRERAELERLKKKYSN